MVFDTQVTKKFCWRLHMARWCQDSTIVLCRPSVLNDLVPLSLASQQLCPPCCSLMKPGHWAEKVALTQIYWRIVAVKWLHSDVGVSFGSFLSGLKDECPPRQAVHSRLPLLQCSHGYGNCHPWMWPGAISLLLESSFSSTLPSEHRSACF